MNETCAVCKKSKGPTKCEICEFSNNDVINREFQTPPAKVRFAKIMVLFAKTATVIKKPLFWPVFISIVLNGIMGGLLFALPYYIRESSAQTIIANMFIGGLSGFIGGVTNDYIKTLIGYLGYLVKNMNNKNSVLYLFFTVFRIIWNVFLSILWGVMFSSLAFCFLFIFSVIFNSFLTNLPFVGSIAIVVIIGALMGVIGSISGYYSQSIISYIMSD